MKIIFEGADKTGKTTLANLLSKKLGMKMFYPPRATDNVSFPEGGKIEHYFLGINKTMLEMFKMFDNFICDRFFISDAVYSKIYGRTQNISTPMITSIEGDVLVVVTTCSSATRMERLIAESPDDTGPEFDEHLHGVMFTEYVKFYAPKFPANFRFLIVDTGRHNEKQCIEMIEAKIKFIRAMRLNKKKKS